MKSDERRLLSKIYKLTGPLPIGIEKELGMHHKRLHSILGKWERKNRWEFGVSMRTGWLTPEGKVWASEQLEQSSDSQHP